MTTLDAWNAIVDKLSGIFSANAVLKMVPMRAHFEAAFRRGDSCGGVPLGVVAAVAAKLAAECKILNPACEQNPALVVAYLRAASLIGSHQVQLDETETGVWLRAASPLPSEVREALLGEAKAVETNAVESNTVDSERELRAGQNRLEVEQPVVVQAVMVPCSVERKPAQVQLKVGKDGYFMDAIARELGTGDAGGILVSKQFGKSNSGLRVYSPLLLPLPPICTSAEALTPAQRSLTGQSLGQSEPTSLQPLEPQPIVPTGADLQKRGIDSEGPDSKKAKAGVEDVEKKTKTRKLPRNECASWLVGQDVYGDAILASVGSTYRDPKPGYRFWFEDLALERFYRLAMSRHPEGAYKQSRQALLAAQLPGSFSTLAKWRGDNPRQLLQTFHAQNKADFQGQPLFHLYTVDERANEVPLLKPAASAHDERPCPRPRHEGATSASSKCGEARCRLTVPVKGALGDATWQFESPATCRTHKDAENAAALQAVRRIQLAHSRRASAVLPWDPPGGAGEGAQGESLVPPKEETPGSVPGAGPRLVSEVEILHAGEEGAEGAGTPPPGAVVTVDYTLKWVLPGEGGPGATRLAGHCFRNTGRGGESVRTATPGLPPGRLQGEASAAVCGDIGLRGEGGAEPAEGSAAGGTAAESEQHKGEEGGGGAMGASDMDEAERGPPQLPKQHCDGGQAEVGEGVLRRGREGQGVGREAGRDDPGQGGRRSGQVLILESNEGFDFELGCGAVIGPLEDAVGAMSACQVARFHMEMPHSWVFDKAANFTGQSESRRQRVECEVKLRGFANPQEERLEGAFFSPPLGKQRLRFALDLIATLGAKSLVDLGCGSGALLKQHLAEGSPLDRVAGVDISHRALLEAQKAVQKSLDSLEAMAAAGGSHGRPLPGSVVLYEGSIAEPDGRLKGFDVATCIEVVEHLDPEPLAKVGDAILGGLQPKALLVSTPNIEYNPILHQAAERAGAKATAEARKNGTPEADPKLSTTKLRNDDHRFEWTREEFAAWACPLAERHGYNLAFSGVGGSEEEPGYASQIAIFRRRGNACVVEGDSSCLGEGAGGKMQGSHKVLWQWPPI